MSQSPHGGPDAGAHRQPGPNELRDHLANERTFLAWIRTAITVIGLGFVVAKFAILLREVGGPHVHPLTGRAGAAVGVVLVLCGIAVVALALLRFLRTRADIQRNRVNFSPVFDIVIAIVLALIGAILAVYMITTA